MTKDEAFEIARRIAKELETDLNNGNLDEKLTDISQEDWEIYIEFAKTTLYEAFKMEPKRALIVASIFN